MNTTRFPTMPRMRANASTPDATAGRRQHFLPMCCTAPLVVLLFAATGHAGAAATPPSMPTLGAHTLLAQSEGKGTDPAISKPIDTQASGSSLLVLSSSYASNATTPSDSYGNHWKPLGSSVVYRGYDGRFSVRAFVATDAKGGSNHQVRIAKPGDAAGEISAPFVEIRHAGVLQDVAQNYPAPGVIARLDRAVRRATGAAPTDSSTLTSGTVTTTGPATLVAVWWGDSRALQMTATPNHGFKLIEQWLDLPPNSAVQCAVAVKQVDGPGTWDVSWSSTPAQGAILWLFAFQARP